MYTVGVRMSVIPKVVVVSGKASTRVKKKGRKG